MHYSLVEEMARVARRKINFFKHSWFQYLLLAILAGIYVGFGIMLVFSIGAPFAPVAPLVLRTLMGVSFAVALTLVIFAGAELFTGNTLVVSIGWLERVVSLKDGLLLSLLAYVGNFLGSILVAWLFMQTGLIHEPRMRELVLEFTALKMSTPFMQLLFRGILCNMLVCLAVWMSARTRDDTAKLILIWWCIFAFVGSGFEHSIANMTLLAMGLMLPHDPVAISYGGFIGNLIPVTFGNIIGGVIFIGAWYWFASKTGEADE